MQDYTTYKADRETDPEAGCLYLLFKGHSKCSALHNHDYYEIFLAVKGTLTHRVNGTTQSLPEGSLVFIRPGDIHDFYDEKPSDVTYVNLTFTIDTAEQLFSYLSEGFPAENLLNSPLPPVVLLTPSEKQKLFDEIDSLNLVNWQDKKMLKLQMRVLLANIFMRFFSDNKRNNDNNIPLWLIRLNEKMSAPENFTAGADKMIELSQKSREHLTRSLKKHYGLSLSEYISDLRLNYASNLLLNSNTPVLDICYGCGFGNVSYFYRTFKKKFSLAPFDFRKKYSKNPLA